MKASERHKLKEDKFAETMLKAVGWARENRSAIITGAGVLLVAIVVVIWIVTFRSSTEKAADKLLRKLEAKIQEAEREPGEERDAALEQVRTLSERMSEQYASTAAVPIALVRTGEALIRGGQAAKAVPCFERAMDLGARRPGVVFLARRGLAEALEELNKPAEAIEQYKLLARDVGSPLAAQANWDIGRCYDALGEHEKAAEFYRKVADFAGDTDWGMMARSRLAHGSPPPGTTSASTQLPVLTGDTVPAGDTVPVGNTVPAADAVPARSEPRHTAPGG